MKYERLTIKRENGFATVRNTTLQGLIDRLAELEDKIERGELCDRDEVRKEMAKKIIYQLRNLSHVGHLSTMIIAINKIIKEIGKDKKMHNILSYSELIQQALDEAIKNHIKANTILINRNLAYFPGEDVRIGNHVCELPSMIMGLEAYFVNDLPEDCVFAICRKEKTEREQLEEEARKETARTCIILAKQYQNSEEIVRDIAEKYDIDLRNEE